MMCVAHLYFSPTSASGYGSEGKLQIPMQALGVGRVFWAHTVACLPCNVTTVCTPLAT